MDDQKQTAPPAGGQVLGGEELLRLLFEKIGRLEFENDMLRRQLQPPAPPAGGAA